MVISAPGQHRRDLVAAVVPAATPPTTTSFSTPAPPCPLLLAHAIACSGASFEREELEPLPAHLTDRAHLGRLRPGAEIAADLAAPDHYWQRGLRPRTVRRIGAGRLCRAPFGYRFHFRFSLQDTPGDVQPSVTGVVLGEVLVAVIAGADDVQVLLLAPAGQPARAERVSVTLHVSGEAFRQLVGERRVRVEVVARICRFAVEAVAQPGSIGCLRRIGAQLSLSWYSDSLNPMMTLSSSTTRVGNVRLGLYFSQASITSFCSAPWSWST